MNRGGNAPSRPRRTALVQAVGYLSRREVSARRLAAYLGRKGYGPEEIAAAIARLQKENYLSEERLAHARARDLSGRRGYWGRALAARLAAEGIEEGARKAALESLRQEGDPEALARESLRRRYGEAWPQASERRLASYLERHGYPVDLIVKLLREARKGRSDGEGEGEGEG